MKLFSFSLCSIFIVVIFFSQEGVCQSPIIKGKRLHSSKDASPAAWET